MFGGQHPHPASTRTATGTRVCRALQAPYRPIAATARIAGCRNVRPYSTPTWPLDCLTATAYRRDGLGPVIPLHCGPNRHTMRMIGRLVTPARDTCSWRGQLGLQSAAAMDARR